MTTTNGGMTKLFLQSTKRAAVMDDNYDGNDYNSDGSHVGEEGHDL